MKHPSGMIVQSDRSKPYVVSAMKLLADTFPCTIFKLGGFNDRDARGHPGVKSMHAFGRAIDIYLDVKYPPEKALAEALFNMFKTNAAALKTHVVIFNDTVWYRGTAANTTTAAAHVQDLHDDHVHIDFMDDGMTGYPNPLAGLLVGVRSMLNASVGDWINGFYGPGFNPLKANTRLTPLERLAIYDLYRPGKRAGTIASLE